MDSVVESVLARLRETRSPLWLQIIDEADLDRPADPEPDVERVVAPYSILLARVGDGIQLTKAGYLPPAFVFDLLTALGWDAEWPGKNFREDLTRPILWLRESAQRFGLLRKYRGRLLLTKEGRTLANDSAALWWQLADRLPDARLKPDVEAGILCLLLFAAGRPCSEPLLVDAMSMLGWVLSDNEPVTGESIHYATFETRFLFRRLKLFVDREHWAMPEIPTEHARRLARAALLGSSAPATPHVPAAEHLIRLTVTLRDVEPVIWRRLQVPDSLTLRELHDVLWPAMGWEGYHLHLFDIGDMAYGDFDEDFTEVDGRKSGDETAVSLGEIAATISDFRYDYDFGDGWEHDVHIEAITAVTGPAVPIVLDGALACPPEDCGGPGGYADLLQVLADPGSNLYEHLRSWAGDDFDPEAFDKNAKNELLALYDRHTRQRRGSRHA